MKITDNKWITLALLALLGSGIVAGQASVALAADTEMSTSADGNGDAEDSMDNYDNQSDTDESMQDEDTGDTSSQGE